jgi:hypothetical protein
VLNAPDEPKASRIDASSRRKRLAEQFLADDSSVGYTGFKFDEMLKTKKKRSAGRKRRKIADFN